MNFRNDFFAENVFYSVSLYRRRTTRREGLVRYGSAARRARPAPALLSKHTRSLWPQQFTIL